MRYAATVLKVLMWVSLVVILGVQLLVILSISVNNENAAAVGKTQEIFNLLPIYIACGLMAAGVIVFMFVKRFRWIGMALMALAAVIFVLTALAIGRTFFERVGTSGTYGISAGKLIRRHISPVLIPLLAGAQWICSRRAEKEEEMRKKDHKSRYDLSGKALFSDDGGEQPMPTHRMKRSVRKREENKR